VDATLFLEIVTPARTVFCGHVSEVRFPTAHRGIYGIYPGHTPLMTILGSGLLRFSARGHEHWTTLLGGLVEVRPDRVTILTREAETVDTIDLSEEETHRARAQRALIESRTEHDLELAQIALERSLARTEAMHLALILGPPTPPRCAKCGCERCECC
jgi:F-type H+-transporting ATPase subunit epsilon